MLFFRKPTKIPTSLEEFSAGEYDVYEAGALFSINLYDELAWHKKHIKKLEYYLHHPEAFHKDHGREKPEDRHHAHYHEHVVESLPFHQKLLEEHKKRLATVRRLMPKVLYQRIVKITKQAGGVADYLVYDPKQKRSFFIIEHLTVEKLRWKHLIKDKHDIAEVMVF
jgi:hypothetical protein